MVIIIVGVALGLIIILIIVLMCLRIKGQKISKVEKLTGKGQVGIETSLSKSPSQGPMSKPNFGDDDSDDSNVIKQSNNPMASLFKNQQD